MPKWTKRAGPGRPKGSVATTTLEKRIAHARLVKKVVKALDPMVDAQIAHATGIKFLVARRKNGGKFERVTQEELEDVLAGQDDGRIVLEVFDKDPSVQAFTDLLNRALGKPVEHVEMAGDGGGPLVIKHELAD